MCCDFYTEHGGCKGGKWNPLSSTSADVSILRRTSVHVRVERWVAVRVHQVSVGLACARGCLPVLDGHSPMCPNRQEVSARDVGVHSVVLVYSS